MEFIVDRESDGMLLRTYLKRIKLSAKLIRHLKEIPNGITVNGEHATVRRMLKNGDRIGVAVEDIETDTGIEAIELPITVLYEDGDLLVCSKPPNMPTHPSHGHHDDTLANAVAFYYKGKPFVFRPVNRLDRNTSGIVLIAKNARAAAIMFEEMRKKRIEKTYVAVVEGELCGSGVIDRPMRRTAESIIVREVCENGNEGAQEAVTRYAAVASSNGLSCVLLRPVTGRTHQLRVHLASIGHSICGDDLYGRASNLIERQALHAYSLSFSRPSDNERVTVTAPLPEDILRLTDIIGINGDLDEVQKTEF